MNQNTTQPITESIRPASIQSPSLLQRLARYGAVGVVAAAVHAAVLLGLGRVIPLWLANPFAFLTASLAGYLGHALVTFREETGGQRFARRWLLLQYGVNLSVCAVLPLLMSGWAPALLQTLVMVFTPTVLNALIWSRAARFSARYLRAEGHEPHIHADDLGLAAEVDTAILDLVRAGSLDGASLLVDGPTAETAVQAWQRQASTAGICLHLCLTEGPATPGCPDLPASFGQLLLASLLPTRRRLLQPQLTIAIRRQIKRYQELTGLREIQLDGHQHIHLVPIVMETLLQMAPTNGIRWMRSTREPLPTGLSLACWWNAIRNGGLLKWLVLQWLTALAVPKLHRAGIATNRFFGGVLFTGQMTGERLRRIEQELSARGTTQGPSQNILLAHPAAGDGHSDLIANGFVLSDRFFRDPGRQEEWQALKARAPHG